MFLSCEANGRVAGNRGICPSRKEAQDCVQMRRDREVRNDATF